MQPLSQFNNCTHLVTCGGCQVEPKESYRSYLSRKLQSLEPLKQIFGLEPDLLIPVRKDGYRVKVEWRLRQSGGEVRVGYFKENSREFFAISECPVLHPRILEFHLWLQTLSLQKDGQGSARLILQLFDSQSKLAALLISEDSLPELEQNLSHSPLLSFYSRRERIQPSLLLDHGFSGQTPTKIRPGQFVQSHCEAEKTLQDEVWSILEREGIQEFCELFCGNAHLSLGFPGRVRGYDLDILAAQSGSRHEYHKMDLYRDLPEDTSRWRHLVADPGRSGLKGYAGKWSKFSSLENFIYISCHPESLAKDSPPLLASGFKVASWKVLDLFPWTKHLEIITHFKRG